jgi:hypothetical protein
MPVELRGTYLRGSKEAPMLRFRKLHSLLGLGLLVTSLLSCGTHDSNEYFVFVAANLQVPIGRLRAPVSPRPVNNSKYVRIF